MANSLSAAMTLVGFVLMYPGAPLTPSARSAIELSLVVFGIFGNNFDVAAGAANIVRDLCTKIDVLAEQTRVGQAISDSMLSVTNLEEVDEQPLIGNEISMATVDNAVNFDSVFYDMDGQSQNLFDMALAVDFWADIDMLWPNTDPLPENWTFAT
jgi:hypothetical protein